MNHKTHSLMAGAGTIFLMTKGFPLPPLTIATSYLAAKLPDIDSEGSYISRKLPLLNLPFKMLQKSKNKYIKGLAEHRGILHAIDFFCLECYLYYLWRPSLEKNISFLLLSLLLGKFFHLIGDFFHEGGIPLSVFLRKRDGRMVRVGVRIFWYESFLERYILQPAMLLYMIYGILILYFNIDVINVINNLK